ncbi:MAG: DNA polymerase I [Gammaproteobacteria bacterium]|nr:DNA polymerase I [Gammaproteobacteria bacterium]
MLTSNTRQQIVLVDGSSYLFRAFHSLPALTNSQGEPTGAIYGVLNMLRRLQKDYAPAYIAVVFDAKGKNFRHELYSDYKAHRPPMPTELASQIAPLQEIIRALGMPLIIQSGVEADDVLGTLAKQAEAAGLDVVISTGDKDMAQLVNERVTLINTMTDTRMDSAGVEAKFGVKPTQIIDYLALMGDTSDNIPGVPKVGPKTAAKWLQEYQSLDGVIANVDKISGKVGENLRSVLELLPLSRNLTTIRCDVALDREISSLQLAPPDVNTLREWYKRYEFKSWLAELNSKIEGNEPQNPVKKILQNSIPPAPVNTPVALDIKVEYEIILQQAQLDAWLARLHAADYFAFDTETTSLNYMDAELVGVSFATEVGKAAYIPLAHDYLGAPIQLSRDGVLAALKPLLEKMPARIVGQHIKYDRNVLRHYNIELNAIAHDTMLESYILDSAGSRHDMDTLAKKYLDYDTTTFVDVAGKGAKQITFNQVEIETAAHYAAEDADITLRLHETLWPKLQANPSLQHVYETLERPLIPVLSRMEYYGVKVDAAQLRALSAGFAQRIAEVEAAAHTQAGGPFNLNSPKQIQEILFVQQKIPALRKTPGGVPSTAEDVLEELSEQGHELPRLLLEHRSLSKLKSTYTDKLPEQINARTGRVHTSYHQAIAATGRLSSTDPNLQNIPIRHEAGRLIRQAFIAETGHSLIAADYSQIELRIMAHLSEDPTLCKAFEQGIDVHRATAAEVFDVAVDAVSQDQRRAAKAINFGLIYGMSAFGLAKQLDLGRQEAQHYIDRYFARYPGVKNYMERTRQQARDQGYIETVFGRRLYLPDIKASNAQRRQYAERTAINAPMQGTAADIIKMAMIAVDAWLQESHLDVRMIMQVHDELVLEAPTEKIPIIVDGVRQRMMSAAKLNVALEVDVGTGLNWDAAH